MGKCTAVGHHREKFEKKLNYGRSLLAKAKAVAIAIISNHRSWDPELGA